MSYFGIASYFYSVWSPYIEHRCAKADPEPTSVVASRPLPESFYESCRSESRDSPTARAPFASPNLPAPTEEPAEAAFGASKDRFGQAPAAWPWCQGSAMEPELVQLGPASPDSSFSSSSPNIRMEYPFDVARVNG